MKKKISHINLAALSRTLVYILVLAGLILAPNIAQARSPMEMEPQRVDRFLLDEITKYRIPGLAVAIIQDDQVVFMKGYGQAGQNQAVTPQTQFYLGSVTKSFTALAVMQLVERGKLELDAPVQHYLPWFQVADPEAARQITIRHLLNHTSGLSEGADPGVINFSPTLTEQVHNMRIAGLTAPVGTKYQYDSQNYRLLGLLIETVSGQSYGEYLREHVFTPLGMDHSAADPGQAPDLAQGHGSFLSLPLPRSQKFQPAGLPSGYLISSVEDLGRYMITMLDHGRYDDKSLIQEQSFTQMMTPPQGIDSEYGMGWVVTTSSDGYKMVYHGGSLSNFHSFIAMLPEQRLAMALLINQSGMIPMLTGLDSLKRGLLNLLVGDPIPPRPSYEWIYWALAAVVGLDLGSQIYRIARLPEWSKKVSGQSHLLRWLRVFVDLVIPLALFFGLPPLLNAELDGSASWPDALDLIPDVTLWLLVGMALSLARGIAKLILVLRGNKVI